ncbi:MAG: IS1595 family transposase [Saprospiraceae bacterium]|nr:IS1595 family transposase [Saprospiraceae bacterium]MBX7176329.1 IS1595 family transposase [Saprospiraceae bacterium]HMW39212.1 IS1595 family transposase [Saprospiraceae bacterium]HMX88966.1 IS1595 family transposase [Saprospiraceae bacterium]HMZ40865.1 IS1595 family transposase [Saprospiraceae bacterium]
MLGEFKTIFDLQAAFPTEQDCINHLESILWNETPVSPFDQTSKVYKCTGGKYKCKNTGKYFNVKVGTIFEDTKIPLIKWFMALFIFSSHKKGISSHQLAKDIGVTQKSAWFMLHRLRYAFDHPTFKEIMGDNVIEIDETYMGGEYKNKHSNRKKKGTQGRSVKDKTPVLGIKERNGNIVATVIEDTKGSTIQPIIRDHVEEGSIISTDEWFGYNGLHKDFTHIRVNHSAKEYVNMMASTNGVENFWSHLKRGINGINHWVSQEHLQKYVNEYCLRYNTRKYTTNERFNLLLANINFRITYANLICHEK